MTVEQRAALMSRIRGRNTGPEKAMRQLLERLGLDFEEHVKTLPGRPDFVLTNIRVAILVDGDFWHGWHFDKWKHKLAQSWRKKIAGNIRRDRKNRGLLRAEGWLVIRVWEHQLERSPALVRRRVRDNIRRASAGSDLAKRGEAVIQQV